MRVGELLHIRALSTHQKHFHVCLPGITSLLICPICTQGRREVVKKSKYVARVKLIARFFNSQQIKYAEIA